MLRFVSLICILVCVVAAAGCWRSSTDDAANNANSASQPLGEYSDANQALADGTKYLDEGETDKAIDALSQATKLNPDLAEAWFKLGVAYGLSEKRDETAETTNAEPTPTPEGKREAKTNSEKAFEKAVAAYKKVVDANDKDDVAYYNLGRAYNKLNDDEDAAKALKNAVRLKPDDTEYQTELGAILIKLAQYHEAIAPLKKALELDPENVRAIELLEDAEAGRRRVNYSSTPKEDKKGNSNTNSNTTSPPDDDRGPPPPPPPTGQPKPRPTASRPTT